MVLHAQGTTYPGGSQVSTGDLAVTVSDQAALPVPSVLAGQLSRVTAMRFEPGDLPQFALRTFVVDLDGQLYIFDRHTGRFTTYIDFASVFARFVNGGSYGAGLAAIAFDPDYQQNGRLYTVHTEASTSSAPAVPSTAALPGLDLGGGYSSTLSINPPTGSVQRQSVLIEWSDTDLSNSVFEGTAREVLRIGFSDGNHAVADMLFKPALQAGDPDYGNLYLALGDGGAGEVDNAGHRIPQRLDALPGKLLRITPDLDRRPADRLSANERYRIPTTGPDPNPFVTLGTPGTREEIFAYGFRNPQRMSWDGVSHTLIVADIGNGSWEEVNIVRKGANYGYAEREGPEQLFVGGVNSLKTASQTTPPVDPPDPDELAVEGLDAPTVPTYPAAVYSHHDGDAIAGGFVYRGSRLPHLYGKYVFGDVTTARLFYVDVSELIAADDGVAGTVAPIHEIQVLFDDPDDAPDRGPAPLRMFDVIADEYARRGGLPGGTARLPDAGGHLSDRADRTGYPYGGGRADIRFAQDRDGELYVLSKSDGMIRLIGDARTGATTTTLTTSPNPSEIGGTIALTAQVAAAAGAVDGQIEFFDHDLSLGVVTLAGGVATTSVSGVAPGSHVFSARFIPASAALVASVGRRVHKVGRPDLFAAMGAIPAAAAPGAKVTLTETTTNAGYVRAGASTTRYVLSVDRVRDTGDAPFGSRSVSALAVDVSSTGSASPTVPATLALGHYFVIACADAGEVVPEANEQNNCAASTATLHVTRPDLVSIDLSVAAAFVAPDSAFKVTETVRNNGGIAAIASTTRFYLSIDSLISAGDVRLTGTRSVGALVPGASSTKAGTVLTVPSTTPLGSYTLLVCADDTAKNVEISETNNCTPSAAPLVVGRPDLVVSTLSNPPAQIAPGKTLSVKASTHNHGSAPAVASVTKFYLSVDSLKDPSDIQVSGTVSVGALAVATTSSTTRTLTIPAATPIGVYQLLACADATALNLELDEGDNCRAAASAVAVKAPDLIELSVSDPPSSIAVAGTLAVTDSVANNGTFASSTTSTRYYLSVDTLKTPDDVLLGGRSVPPLAAGARNTATKVLSVPNLGPGTYYLLACADDKQVDVESNEGNNCAVASATTVLPPP